MITLKNAYDNFSSLFDVLYKYWTSISIKAYEIPEASRTSRGTAIINLIPLQPKQEITEMIPIREYEEDKYLFMATKNGIVKRHLLKIMKI